MGQRVVEVAHLILLVVAVLLEILVVLLENVRGEIRSCLFYALADVCSPTPKLRKYGKEGKDQENLLQLASKPFNLGLALICLCQLRFS
jgi:hypothetical protein